ncbi:hypothetical protein LA324_05420 [Corynebacterium coyleae]|uniref:hypothetical protein n=1 Tax=Corynebacterium coyleae TaxID=53374 RepID=UPI001CCC339A|nr:hypothetical protein [Corynebacterium coyleae]UBI10049.1 hypothetical protein LA324_05420 [Corynebacterium coyleae]
MAHLTWWYDEEALNRVLVRESSIPKETLLIANWIAAIGAVRLAAHHANNVDDPRPDSSVSVSRGAVDAFANLDDPDGGATPIAKFLGIFSPYGFDGTGAKPKESEGSKKPRKRLRKGYGKKR